MDYILNSAQLPGQSTFSGVMNFNDNDLANSRGRGRPMPEENADEQQVRSYPASSGKNLPNYSSFSESIKFPTAHRSTRLPPSGRTPFALLYTNNNTSKTPSVVQFDFSTPALRTDLRSSSKEKQKELTNSSRRQSQSVLSLLQNANSGSSSARALRTNYEKKISMNFERSTEVQPAIFQNNVSTTSSLKRPANNKFSSEDEFFSTPAQRAKQISLRTTSSSVPTIAEPSNQSTVLALIEGRGRAKGEVGMAVMDLERPNLILCQISDSQTYVNTVRKINILHPAEIIIPYNSLPGLEKVNMNSNLHNLLRERFPTIRLTTVQRKYFNDTAGWQVVQNLCLDEYSSILPVIQKKSYALGAAGALLKYAEFHQNLIFSPKSLRTDYQSGDKVMFIDLRSAENLELTVCHEVETNTPFNTFFGVLNKCCTIGGQKRLRSVILQPSTDISEIESRLQCVQELLENEALFQSMKTILPKLWDVERLLSLCGPIADSKNTDMAAELQINYLLSLKTSLEVIPALNDVLLGTNSNFFINLRRSLCDNNYKTMLDRIYQVLNEDAHLGPQYDVNLFQRCFAIKTGINSFLDIARIAYTELVQDFNEIVEELIRKYHLPLEVKILRNKGPVIRLKATKLKKDLPKVFIQVHKTKHMITMTTKDLLFLKERMNHFIQEIQLLSSSIVFEVLRDIREYIGSLYVFCENIAELDLIVSFAHVSKHMGYVRPQFTEDHMMVQSSVHPILNQTSTCRPMPNDIIASIHENVCLITGPNMGGKSIYIRQVALLQIMAQIGCFVPADVALFRLTDSIFSRIGFEDNIESNASSFIVEIKEMHYILQHVTPRSIIIIDELCRGTSTEEGTALAWAITEELLATSAFTFFATHFFYLTKLQDLYCNVQNYHFEAVEVNPGTDSLPFLSYTHRLVPGVLRLENYGLKLARSTAIPDKILLFAQDIVHTLTLTWKACSVANEIITPEKRVDTIIMKLLSFMDDGTLSVNIVDELIEYVNEMGLIPATKSKVQKQKIDSTVGADEDADVALADLNSSSRKTVSGGVTLQHRGKLPQFLRSNSSGRSEKASCCVDDESDEMNNNDVNTPSKESDLEMRENGVEYGNVKTPANIFSLSSIDGHRNDRISSSARAFDARQDIRRGPVCRDCFSE